MNIKYYEQANIDKTKIAAAAQKALIAADPQYFAWPSEQQERFRATMNEDARIRVKRILLASLLGIQCSLKQVDKIWDDVPMEQLNLLNWASLLTTGIGEDNIYLNEYMGEGKSLLDFETLYDYDYDDYLFQEEGKSQNFTNYEGIDYYALMHPTWIRLLVNDQFYYASLFSLAGHFIDQIELAGDEIIAQLIPHKYVDGIDDGKPVQGGYLLSMNKDAGGLEGQLDELKSRWYEYRQARRLDLHKMFSQSPPAVYIQETNWDNDPHQLFIFNNVDVLKKIRWRHFLSDSRPFMTEFSTLDAQLNKEIELAKSWLTDNYQDIISNFDPTVVKLQKKYKIIMTPGILDQLNKMSDHDDSPE